MPLVMIFALGQLQMELENQLTSREADYAYERPLHCHLRIGCETCTLEVFSAIRFEGSFMSTVHVPLFLSPIFLL